MSSAQSIVPLHNKLVDDQPRDVRGLAPNDRDYLVVSWVTVDGQHIVVSRYGEDEWVLAGRTTNTRPKQRTLDFARVPLAFRSTLKAVMYRYLRRGLRRQMRPNTATLRILLKNVAPFLRHLEQLHLTSLTQVNGLVCSTYVEACKAERLGKRNGKSLATQTLHKRFRAVEALHDLSQYTEDQMPHPWPGNSAAHLAGITGPDNVSQPVGDKTALIPDEVFCSLFQRAWELVERGPGLLDQRDALDEIKASSLGMHQATITDRQSRYLSQHGWHGGLEAFNRTMVDLRTSCYIVAASVSGCRNHELAFIQTDACYRTENDDGEIFWWMRSQSTKTDEGHTEWMIPEAAVTALRVMDRWARPYQANIDAEITARRAADPRDLEIAEALRHRGAVFLGMTERKSKQVRTLTASQWNKALKGFASRCGLEWNLANHQFRRKFANYAARSRFGDLRYLREHFKHWSMDMTLGYALNESQEMALYMEIEDDMDDIKEGLAEQWLQHDQPLAGGYGQNIVHWRGNQAVTLFKDHKAMIRSIAESTSIRSNGHAWCTADDSQCVGNGGLDATRCSSCNNAVIGRQHARLYQRLYDDLMDVQKCDDIGQAGLARVQRDLGRCRTVLMSLGYDPETPVREAV